ncbi:MAG TPA: type III pantothenate kinase [Verrucomicrobiales bacterium]|jgi:type III pantothenate kinase|nr:type III pantothenate kinase [Verrucomicrobiales bacterium]HIL71236.1 type III pantothenate kinase [Verrucomicrobiota bacterium]
MKPNTINDLLLLLDVGNTHTHVGISRGHLILREKSFPTHWWRENRADAVLKGFVRFQRIDGSCFCSVVPGINRCLVSAIRNRWHLKPLELKAATLTGIGIDYPKPASIGSDRLSNALAASNRFGCPVVVVDFGTAVTFDIVNSRQQYIGGIIAPGLSVMTDYLHQKTALLPKIKIKEPHSVIGKNTEEAMLVGAVHGYRGLIRELLKEIKGKLKREKLPVVATGGYSKLMASRLSEIQHVEANLTLEGLRIFWNLKALSR